MRRLQRTIEDIGWTRDVPRVAETEPVAAACDLMRAGRHDCVLVVDEAALIGIFTSRDYLNRVAAAGADPEEVQVGAVMTRAPRTLSPRDPVAFAVNWMSVEGFRNVPVVDGRGLQGVLTIWDVLRQLSEMFDEIDAMPRLIHPDDDISGMTTVDLGGGS